MGGTPLISVIIPVFNGANYLREAVESVLKQTCNDYELIVVNDGSNDGGATENIAESFGDKIRYFYKENGGVASALNVGISHMRGEWFVWLSHDDLMSINRIDADRRQIQMQPNVRVFFCKTAEIDALGRLIKETYYPIQKVTNPRDALQLGGVDFCAMTIHYSCFEKVGLFNEENRTCQDVEMSLKLASAFPFFFNQGTTVYKREHQDRGTRTLTNEQSIHDLLLLAKTIHDEIGFESFFNGIGDDANARSQAWVQMGDVYEWLGAFHYVEECRRNSGIKIGFVGQLVRSMELLRIKSKNPLLIKLLNLQLLILNKAYLLKKTWLHAFK